MWKSVRERGSWQGEIWDRRKNGEVYPKWLSISAVPDENGHVVRYIGLFSDITAVKQTHEQLYHMANYDSLTGLANRRFFHDRLEQSLQEARRSGEMVAVMFIDLDGFKLINDNIGHRAGDALLRAVADRIRENVRDSDTVARMGGDEFTVVLPRLRTPSTRVLVAQKILTRVAEPVTVEQPGAFHQLQHRHLRSFRGRLGRGGPPAERGHGAVQGEGARQEQLPVLLPRHEQDRGGDGSSSRRGCGRATKRGSSPSTTSQW